MIAVLPVSHQFLELVIPTMRHRSWQGTSHCSKNMKRLSQQHRSFFPVLLDLTVRPQVPAVFQKFLLFDLQFVKRRPLAVKYQSGDKFGDSITWPYLRQQLDLLRPNLHRTSGNRFHSHSGHLHHFPMSSHANCCSSIVKPLVASTTNFTSLQAERYVDSKSSGLLCQCDW